ncbi:hypothetical protein GBAR_LOCUS1699 [Geodia barretti]|uniref:Uncharacterized protein n=1 Tax=Geodia barretti TaxID=519541 RepID=A0AA35VWI5_GEOBA|nr:hypothetical protein GBAR_LOCUS1699 [Geodia barretti]
MRVKFPATVDTHASRSPPRGPSQSWSPHRPWIL